MKRVIFFTLLIACVACKEEPAPAPESNFNPAATFVVENNLETMPVWVNGKAGSKYVILVFHGGPGQDVLDFRKYQDGTAFMRLEEEFLVAYWQQRASGQSTGPKDSKYYTINQYINDADKVVDRIKELYPGKKIILLGHSWGGMLSAAYFSNATRISKIDAWIDAAGAHNGTILFSAGKADLKAEAEARILNNQSTAYWDNIKSQLQSAYVNANALAYEVVQEIPEVNIKVSIEELTGKMTSRANDSNSSLFREILLSDFTTSASAFNKPVLFLWGKYDFVVSKTLRDQLIPLYDASKVKSVTFPASGHYLMYHEPGLFSTSIINFLNSLPD